jgi:hypothetical protein
VCGGIFNIPPILEVLEDLLRGRVVFAASARVQQRPVQRRPHTAAGAPSAAVSQVAALG